MATPSSTVVEARAFYTREAIVRGFINRWALPTAAFFVLLSLLSAPVYGRGSWYDAISWAAVIFALSIFLTAVIHFGARRYKGLDKSGE